MITWRVLMSFPTLRLACRMLLSDRGHQAEHVGNVHILYQQSVQAADEVLRRGSSSRGDSWGGNGSRYRQEWEYSLNI